MRRSSDFKPGQSGNPNGRPVGRSKKGRPPNYLKRKCQQLLDHKEVFQFLKDVVTGNPNADYTLNMSGKVIPIPPRARLRLDAIHDLMNRGYGLPTQSIELSGLEDVHDDLADRYDSPTQNSPLLRKNEKK